MKKTAFLLLGLLMLLSMVSHSQEMKTTVHKKPHIVEVSQINYPTYIEILVRGTNFPFPYDYMKNICLNGTIYCMSGNTPTSRTLYSGALVTGTVQSGRVYKVALRNKNDGGKLITNEVDYLLTYNLVSVDPDPKLAQPGSILTVKGTQQLGPRGTKIVKFGNTAAQVTAWDENSNAFKIRVPANVIIGARQELFIENNGEPISNKLSVRIGIPPHIGK